MSVTRCYNILFSFV